MGRAQTVEEWGFGQFGPAKNGTVQLDPKGLKLWVDPEQGAEWDKKWGWERGERYVSSRLKWSGTNGRSWTLGTCPWALHGVWDLTTGACLKKDYFKAPPATTKDLASLDFLNDYFSPFFEKFGRRIRKSHANAILFVQPPVFATPPTNIPNDLLERAAYAPHYYDGLTLVSKHWNWFNADALGLIRGKYSSTLPAVKIGNGAIRKSLREQLGLFVEDTQLIKGDPDNNQTLPVVIGEIGTPFDMV
jgi:hypothetical protein